MPVKGIILSYAEVKTLERISTRTLFLRLQRGDYLKAKTGRRLCNGHKEYGVPVWCLSPEAQRRWLRRHPKDQRDASRELLRQACG